MYCNVVTESHLYTSRRRCVGMKTLSTPARVTPRRMKGATVVFSGMPAASPHAATAPLC